ADANQIRQMILNLVLNAAEATGQRGDVVIATAMKTIDGRDDAYGQFTGRRLAAGDYLSLQVVDTAGGICEATLSHIFDPFFTTREEGRGLGLAAVLGIVRGHKAGLAVYGHEREGRAGTIFEILFPVSQQAEREAG